MGERLVLEPDAVERFAETTELPGEPEPREAVVAALLGAEWLRDLDAAAARERISAFLTTLAAATQAELGELGRTRRERDGDLAPALAALRTALDDARRSPAIALEMLELAVFDLVNAAAGERGRWRGYGAPDERDLYDWAVIAAYETGETILAPESLARADRRAVCRPWRTAFGREP